MNTFPPDELPRHTALKMMVQDWSVPYTPPAHAIQDPLLVPAILELLSEQPGGLTAREILAHGRPNVTPNSKAYHNHLNSLRSRLLRMEARGEVCAIRSQPIDILALLSVYHNGLTIKEMVVYGKPGILAGTKEYSNQREALVARLSCMEARGEVCAIRPSGKTAPGRSIRWYLPSHPNNNIRPRRSTGRGLMTRWYLPLVHPASDQ